MATVNQLKRMTENQLLNQNYQILAKAYGPDFIGKSKQTIVKCLLERRQTRIMADGLIDVEYHDSVGEVQLCLSKVKKSKAKHVIGA